MNRPAANLRRSKNLATRKIAGEIILVPIRGRLAEVHEIFSLNPTAAHIWDQLDGRRSLQEIHQSLTEHFEVAPEQAWSDLLELVEIFRQTGLVGEPCDGERISGK